MKKHKWQWGLIGVALLLLLSLAPGCVTIVSPDQTARPSGFLTYTDTTNGFSISYPSDWERVSQELLTQGEYVAFWALKLGNGMPPYLSVTEFDLAPGTSLEAYFEQEKAFAAAQPGYTFISKEKVVVNGIPGIILVSTLVHADTSAKMMQLLMVHGNSSWIVNCMCAPELYGKYESTFDSIINSFQIAGASTTAPPTPPTTTTSGFTTYSDTTNDFSISYPSNWERMPQEFMPADSVIGFRILGTTRASFYVYKSQPTPGGNLQTAYSELKEEAEAEPGYLFISKDDMTIDGIPAFKYVFQKSYDGTPATLVYVYLLHGGVEWVIQLTCAPSQSYTQYQSTFDAIIDSFHISGASTTAPPPVTPTPSPGLLTYRDNVNGFSIAYPKDWETMPQVFLPEGIVVGFWRGTDQADPSNYNVGVSEWPSGMSVEDFYQLARSESETEVGYSFISKDNLTINGIPAIKHTFTFTSEGQTLKAMQVLLVKDDAAWLITIGSTPEFFTTHESTFNAIIDSFQIY